VGPSFLASFPRQDIVDEIVMIILLLCQNTTVVGHTVSQPSRDLKELYIEGELTNMKTIRPKFLSQFTQKNVKTFLSERLDCPVNKSFCCLREREIERRESERDERRIDTGGFLAREDSVQCWTWRLKKKYKRNRL